MLITEDGVISFSWSGIANVVETVNGNVKLLPFDKIQQALKNQIKYKKSFGVTDMLDMKDYTVSVISAELRASYIGVKNNTSQALFIPVWVFQTKSSLYNTFLQKKDTWTDNDYLFNAIDGGVIEMNSPRISQIMPSAAASP